MSVNNSHFLFLFKNFQSLQRVSLNFFLKFCNRMDVKKFQRAPFTVFGIVKFFKMNNFSLKIIFSQAQHAMSDFCFFFQRAVFFLCDLFSNLFSSKPPSIFTRNETFCEHEGLLNVFGTMRLAGGLHQKSFSKNFENFFLLFFVEKDGFCCFQLGKNGFRDLCVLHPRVFFGVVKLMKI